MRVRTAAGAGGSGGRAERTYQQSSTWFRAWAWHATRWQFGMESRRGGNVWC